MRLLSSRTRFWMAIYFAWSRRIVRAAWRGLREWCDDAAYDRYLLSKSRHCSDQSALTREEFYVEQLNRRYSRPSRCC